MSVEPELYDELEGLDLELLGTPLQGPQGPQGAKGDKGIPGDVGATPVLSVTSNTLTAGTPANATLTGIYPNLNIDFGIPQGIKGDKGDKGDTGDTGPSGDAASAPNFAFDILTGVAGSDAELDVTGTYPNLLLTFTIPQGATGPSGETTFSDGSAGSPSIIFASDIDTGLYRIGANNIGVSTGGTKRLDISNSGLAITGTLSATGALTQNGNQVWHVGNFNPANYAALTGATFTGNVAAPRFGVDANAYFQIPVADPLLVMDTNDYYGFSRSGNQHVFAIGNSNYLTISTDGVAVIGNITATGTITSPSDRKLKTDIIDLNQEEQLQNIKQLYPAEYIKDGKPDFGVIAQDLQGTAFDRLVSEIDEEGTLGVNYIGLIAPMIAAMKAMAARIEQLEARI